MSLRSNGSYIGPRPAGPSSSVASGIWDLRTAERQKRAAAWPIPGDPYFDSVTLLLHGDGANNGTTFTDSGPLAKSITRVGGAVTSTAQYKFGSASLYFDGTDDQLEIGTSFDSQILDFGSGDFSIEMWFRTGVTATRMCLFSAYDGTGASGLIIQLNRDAGSGPISGSVAVGYGDSSLLTTDGSKWLANTWHYLAVARSGTTIKIFIDGVQEASGTDSTNLNSGGKLSLGGLFASGQYLQDFNGYIDDLRVTKGSARGYTGSTITVPTAAFPNQ